MSVLMPLAVAAAGLSLALAAPILAAEKAASAQKVDLSSAS